MAITKSVPGAREQVNRVEGRQVVGAHGFNAIRDSLSPRTTAAALSGVWGRDALEARVADALRQMERSISGLTTREANLIKDVKNKGRYIGGVMQLLQASRKCEDPTDATALPDAFRGFVVAVHPGFQVCEVEAFRGETDANGEFDLAQYEWMLNPSRANGERAIEAGRRQLLRTQQAIDAVERAVAGGVRFGRS